jgi:hypothetical protein
MICKNEFAKLSLLGSGCAAAVTSGTPGVSTREA